MHYKKSMNIRQNILESCNIVFCSYAEVMNSYPYPSEEEKKLINRPGGHDRWVAIAREKQGILHKITWYRIVLDEA